MNTPTNAPGTAGGWDDAHALSGAYAVDALDDQERTRFEAHLENCAHCRAEVDELRQAAATLTLDRAVAPPASMRDSILGQISSIRPLPPLQPESAAPAAPAQPIPAARAETSNETSTVVPFAARRRMLRRTPLLVAAALVLLLSAGLAWMSPWSGNDSEVHLTAAERVLGADDAHRVEATFPDGARATVVHSRSEGRAVILTQDMALAPEGRVYELWLQTPKGDMVPAGLMPDDADATVLLDGDASRATAVGITVEPDGGSTEPTTKPIAVFPLEA